MSSKDKVDQLVNLYGCVFMSGRAKSAPMLKKRDGYDGDGGKPVLIVLDSIDEQNDVVVPEAVLHDIRLWPHLHESEVMERMFPTAVAAPEVEHVGPAERDELGRLHRRWAAVKIGITRG